MWCQGRTLVLITGASRGLGQAISVEMSKIPSSVLVLISRDINGLETTSQLCKTAKEKDEVSLKQLDLSNATKEDLIEALYDVKADFDSLVLVHNAGSLGNQGTKVSDFDNAKDMQDYFYLNIVSVMLLNSIVYHKFKEVKNKLVVNISSLAAIQPFETWGFYCSGKAARDSLFKGINRLVPE